MSGNPSSKLTKNTVRISEAAHLLGVTPMTLRRWEKAQIIQPLRIGPRKDRRYTKEQIMAFLNQGTK